MSQENLKASAQDSWKAFRGALSRFPTGVTVITARAPETDLPIGLTVSSFNSVSLNPPLVMWAISNKSPNLSAFSAGRTHVIHVLNSTQMELAKHFSTPRGDKFAGVPIQETANASDPPRLADVCVWFKCVTDQLIQAGDHSVVISSVEDYEVYEGESLVFCKSAFFYSDALERISG
jgi:flavin reductase (DIM6/NTAB) family NADH-FMN oxidoreductase RutF